MKSIGSGIKAVALATLIGVICTAKSGLGADAPARPAMNALIEGAKKKAKFPGAVIWTTLKWGI